MNVYTVKPPNKGQIGTLTNVYYSDIVYWGVSAKNHFLFCVLGHTKQNTIHHHGDSKSFVMDMDPHLV